MQRRRSHTCLTDAKVFCQSGGREGFHETVTAKEEQRLVKITRKRKRHSGTEAIRVLDSHHSETRRETETRVPIVLDEV